ncbi:MAG: DoxX family protein [Deltaproteobacteria bacterium]|nr:DoxX family protein [Deltaproteobacteria bacterium]
MKTLFSTESRKETMIWGLSILMAGLFMVTGFNKLMGFEHYTSQFAAWGLPTWMILVVGLMEFGGGLCMLSPKLVGVGACLLGVDMAGAAITHMLHMEGMQALTTVVLMILLSVAGYMRREPLMEEIKEGRDFINHLLPHH